MAIRDEQIQPAVVVHVKERRAPTHEGICGLHQLSPHADVCEIVLAEVVIQGRALLNKIGDDHHKAALLNIAPQSTPNEPCFKPSALSATPASNSTSSNVPSCLLRYRKFGPASFAT